MDKLFFSDLIYCIKKLSNIEVEYNRETEYRIEKRIYAQDFGNGYENMTPIEKDFAMINSSFYLELYEFSENILAKYLEPPYSFSEMAKYKDEVLENLKVFENIINDKDFISTNYEDAPHFDLQ